MYLSSVRPFYKEKGKSRFFINRGSKNLLGKASPVVKTGGTGSEVEQNDDLVNLGSFEENHDADEVVVGMRSPVEG